MNATADFIYLTWPELRGIRRKPELQNEKKTRTRSGIQTHDPWIGEPKTKP